MTRATSSVGPDVVRADPKLRRNAILIILLGCLIGAVSIGWFLPWLDTAVRNGQLGTNITTRAICYAFLVLVAALGVGVIGFGIYATRFGRSVLRTGQYPPPGTRVLRDTPVVRGPVATFTGRGQTVLGVALTLCGVALVALALWGAIALALA